MSIERQRRMRELLATTRAEAELICSRSAGHQVPREAIDSDAANPILDRPPAVRSEQGTSTVISILDSLENQTTVRWAQ